MAKGKKKAGPALAWRTRARGFQEVGIYAAPTEASARSRSWEAARDAGYNLEFSDIGVERSPEYDGLVAAGLEISNKSEEYVRTVLDHRPSLMALARISGKGEDEVRALLEEAREKGVSRC